MDLVFDISSSMRFWRTRYPADSALKPSAAPLPECPVTATADIWALAPEWVDERFLAPDGGRFHVMAFDHADRRQTESITVHTWSRPIAPGSFYELRPHVYIASPEFIFLVAANILAKPHLIALGDEICGLYGFDPDVKRGLRKRAVPLTNKKRLAGYLDKVDGCQGARKACNVLDYVVERSGSPMETFDELTMCLPYRLGGYGLRVPEMNRYFELTPSARKLIAGNKCASDLCWLDKRLAVEHLGEYDHSLDGKRLEDRARVNALEEMGFEVIELTGAQVDDLEAYEVIVRRIASILGKRISVDKLGPTPERVALRRELKEWNKSYGRIRAFD